MLKALPNQAGSQSGLERAEHLQRRVIADEAEDDEEGQHHHREGNHHGREHEDEEKPAAFEADLGEPIGDDGAGERRADDGEGRDEQRVAGVEGEISLVGGDGASSNSPAPTG